MPASAATRGMVALAGVLLLILLALATAPWAEATTIYACANKQGHALHLVSRTTKCSKGEAKRSWNTQGPRGRVGASGVIGVTGVSGPAGATSEGGVVGATGARGVTGVTGASGAVGGYSASHAGFVNFTTGTVETPTTILAKSLPAGSFIVSAKLMVIATDTVDGGTWVVQCMLADKPSVGTATEDLASASGVVVPDFSLHTAETTLPLGMAVSTTSASTLTLTCAVRWSTSKTGNFEVSGASSLITAVQTTQNS